MLMLKALIGGLIRVFSLTALTLGMLAFGKLIRSC